MCLFLRIYALPRQGCGSMPYRATSSFRSFPVENVNRAKPDETELPVANQSLAPFDI